MNDQRLSLLHQYAHHVLYLGTQHINLYVILASFHIERIYNFESSYSHCME